MGSGLERETPGEYEGGSSFSSFRCEKEDNADIMRQSVNAQWETVEQIIIFSFFAELWGGSDR